MLKFLETTVLLISLHLNVKWDFFWEYVDEGQVKISKCSTDDQQADYLKFVLVFEKFGNNRISNQGW